MRRCGNDFNGHWPRPDEQRLEIVAISNHIFLFCSKYGKSLLVGEAWILSVGFIFSIIFNRIRKVWYTWPHTMMSFLKQFWTFLTTWWILPDSELKISHFNFNPTWSNWCTYIFLTSHCILGLTNSRFLLILFALIN